MRPRVPAGARGLDSMSERILMIDDDESLAAMVAEYLGGRGYQVPRHDQRPGLLPRGCQG